jgi:hypothetical protein
MKKLIYGCLILLSACSVPKQKGLVYFNDMEGAKGWVPINLSKRYAHSGIYSNKFDSAHAFGITFRQLFREISDDKIIKVKLSFWAYMTPKAVGKMVMEVKKPDNTTAIWTAKDMAEIAPKHNEWQQVNLEFTFNDSINKPENMLAIYPWSIGKGDFYVDDIRLEYILGY